MPVNYTIITDIAEDSLNPPEPESAGLAILFSELEFSYCVADLSRGKFTGLTRLVRNESSGSGNPGEKPSFADFLDEIISARPFLKERFKLVTIAFDGNRSTLIPEKLYDPLEISAYLGFSFGEHPGEAPFSDFIAGQALQHLFSVPVTLVEAMQKHFPDCRIRSGSSVFLETVTSGFRGRLNSPRIFLNLRLKYMDLMIFDGRNLLFFNTFSCQCAEDVAYYLIFVLDQLNMDPEQVPLVLSGETDALERLLDLLYNYVRHVEFAKRITGFKFIPALDQIPSHSYYTLFGLMTCGL